MPAVATVAPEPPPAPPATGELVFDRLVALTRRYHVFSAQTARNLGKSWSDDLPRLRAEFAAAKTDEALTTAVWRFGNSLHDVHCGFHPKDWGPSLGLGFTVGVEKTTAGYQYYVDRLTSGAVQGLIVPGDVVLEVDGVKAEHLLAEHDLASNMNSKDNVADAVASYLTTRRAATTLARKGDVSHWQVRGRAGGAARTVDFTWTTTETTPNYAFSYGAQTCIDAAAKDYGGGYTMTARGYRACIYTSKEPKYRDYPIVRQVSFHYDILRHGVLVDHELIERTLAATKAKGVLIDVQDNHGGMNPNIFVEWWTDKPYTDVETRVVLDPMLLPGANGEVQIDNVFGSFMRWYTKELRLPSPPPPPSQQGGPRLSHARPFICLPDTCEWDNHYTPRHRVTKVPAALLLGPDCASSCDSFAWHFDKLDMGPIVGRPSMAGFTTYRGSHEVRLHDGQPAIGTLEIALAFDTPHGSSETMEGVPIPIDVPVPRTFENRERYDRILVDTAIGALTRGRGGATPP